MPSQKSAKERLAEAQRWYEKLRADPNFERDRQAFIKKHHEAFQPLLDAIARSQRLTAKDFAVTITPCPID